MCCLVPLATRNRSRRTYGLLSKTPIPYSLEATRTPARLAAAKVPKPTI